VDLSALAQRELTAPGRYQLRAARVTPAGGEPWWLRAWSWLRGRWLQLWQAVFARVHFERRTTIAIGDGLLVLVSLVVVVVALRLLRELQIAQSAPRAQGEAIVRAPDAQAIYRRACDAARRGDYGVASLLLFAATIALLSRRGVIGGDRCATVGDLRRELGANEASLMPPFDAVATPFVARAYAERVVTRREWECARDAFESMLPEAARA
jgi:hypothetical protein